MIMKEKIPFDFERFKQEAMEGLYAGKKAGGTDGVFCAADETPVGIHARW